MNTGSTCLRLSIAIVPLVFIAGCSGTGDVEDVPQFSDIEEEITDAMEASDSVSVSITGSSSASAIFDVPVLAPGGVTTEGAVDGSSAAVMFNDAEEPLLLFFDDEALMNLDHQFSMMQSSQDESPGEPTPLWEELSGHWLDVTDSDDVSGEAYRVDAILESISQGWSAEETEDAEHADALELSENGVHELRDEVDVWVYSAENGNAEVVLEASHSQPRLLALREGEFEVTFTGWDEIEVTRPEDELIVSPDEVGSRVQEMLEDTMQ